MTLPVPTCPSCIPVDATESVADPRWSVARGARQVKASKAMRGWRFSSVSYNPEIGLSIADVNLNPTSRDFGRFYPPECRPRDTDFYPRRVVGHRQVPDPGCNCGYHVVADLPDLLGLTRPPIVDGGDVPGIFGFWALLRVEAFGQVAGSAHPADPPRTIRAAQVRLTGTAVVEECVPHEAVELMSRCGLYTVTVASLDGCHEARLCPVPVA